MPPPQVRHGAYPENNIFVYLIGALERTESWGKDPYASLITDHTLVGRKKFSELQTLIIYLIIGKILGTLLGQLTFLPCARLVALVTAFLQKRI